MLSVLLTEALGASFDLLAMLIKLEVPIEEAQKGPEEFDKISEKMVFELDQVMENMEPRFGSGRPESKKESGELPSSSKEESYQDSGKSSSPAHFYLTTTSVELPHSSKEASSSGRSAEKSSLPAHLYLTKDSPMVSQKSPKKKSDHRSSRKKESPNIELFAKEASSNSQVLTKEALLNHQSFMKEASSSYHPFTKEASSSYSTFTKDASTSFKPFKKEASTSFQPFTKEASTSFQPFTKEVSTSFQPSSKETPSTFQSFLKDAATHTTSELLQSKNHLECFPDKDQIQSVNIKDKDDFSYQISSQSETCILKQWPNQEDEGRVVIGPIVKSFKAVSFKQFNREPLKRRQEYKIHQDCGARHNENEEHQWKTAAPNVSRKRDILWTAPKSSRHQTSNSHNLRRLPSSFSVRNLSLPPSSRQENKRSRPKTYENAMPPDARHHKRFSRQ